MPFLHYKRIHRRSVNEQAHLGSLFYGNIDSCNSIGCVRAEVFNLLVTRSGFSKRGLWPLNRDLLTDPLREK